MPNFKFKKLLLLFVIVFLAAGCNRANTQNDQAAGTSEVTSLPQEEVRQTSFSYQGQDGKTALELLKSNYHNVETQTFSFGEMVIAINGTDAEEGKNFWSFYVNGQQAQVGASQYVTKSTDIIEWKLEEIK